MELPAMFLIIRTFLAFFTMFLTIITTIFLLIPTMPNASAYFFSPEAPPNGP